jgi:hypothetical protein
MTGRSRSHETAKVFFRNSKDDSLVRVEERVTDMIVLIHDDADRIVE